jgi:hypothetical protein
MTIHPKSEVPGVNSESTEPVGLNRKRVPDDRTAKAIWTGVSMVCLAVCMLVVFRPFWMSHFDLVLSDPVDGRFSISILEHWSRVFHSQTPFASPNFFFPERGTLGFSEAFFLLAIPFTALKAMGLDRYLAFQFTIMLFIAIGFLSMLHLLHRGLDLARELALAGAVLLAASNMYYIHIVHPQLASVALVPLLVILCLKYSEIRMLQPTLARVYLSAGAVLLALLFFTSFYVGWFTVVFCGTIGSVFLICTCVAERSFSPFLGTLRAAWSQKWNFALAGALFLLALIPFLMVYLPALHNMGVRTLNESFYYMAPPLGVFDVGRANLVWGRVSAIVERLTSPHGLHEHPAGWPLITFCVFAVSAVYGVIGLLRCRKDDRTRQVRFCWMAATSLSCIMLCFAGIRFGNDAPMWTLLWRVVPGAKAIRVPPRINLVINVGVVTVAMLGLDGLIRAMSHNRLRGYLPSLLLVAAMLIEQVNLMPTHLISRAAESHKFAKISSPPKTCSEFYLTNEGNQRLERLISQTDAMLVADDFGVPTINGYSGWFPNGWNFLNAPNSTIAQEARNWAVEHRLSGLCALDISSGQWQQVELPHP